MCDIHTHSLGDGIRHQRILLAIYANRLIEIIELKFLVNGSSNDHPVEDKNRERRLSRLSVSILSRSALGKD